MSRSSTLARTSHFHCEKRGAAPLRDTTQTQQHKGGSMIVSYRTKLLGRKFGRLTVLSCEDNTTSNGDLRWKCECECGNVHVATGACLKAGKVTSCGCARKFNLSPHWKGVGELSQSFFFRQKIGAERRGLSFNVSMGYLWGLFQIQQGRCVFTGRLLSFGKSTKDAEGRTASLDRIDSAVGYEEGNLQWIHKDLNHFKRHLHDESFLGIIKEIYEHTFGVKSK